jgi:homoserine O-acetyltransferase/O-succinyltransferase
MNKFLMVFLTMLFQLQSPNAVAQTFPNQTAEVWTAKDFRFHTGEVMPSMNIGYTTLGNRAG